MKMSLLTMVQKILSDMDAEPVNSIGDSLEALQVASIIEDTYYNIVTNKNIPEFNHLLKLTALSNSATPTHFQYPTAVDKIEKVWYDVSSDGTFEYGEVYWMDPGAFLEMVDSVNSNYVFVSDMKAGTQLRIRTDKHPEYYSSFDDDYIVMDSHLSTLDSTLQASKTRASGVKIPVFDATDDAYTALLDDNLFPLFFNESKSVSMSILKGSPDPKVDQAARRARYNYQNDRYKADRPIVLSRYGR
jgi:hypothetical protein